MKKNVFMRAALLLLVLTLITSCFVGGTFAKYTSSKSTTSTATVARWSFNVNGKNIVAAEDFALNIFETILDSNGTDAELDVSIKKIAPGTSGVFTLSVENTSEVTATYTVSLTDYDGAGVPLEFSTDGSSWTTDVASVTVSNTLAAGTNENTAPIYWRWSFNDVADLKDDDTDTNLGKAATLAQPSITVKVVAVQVD